MDQDTPQSAACGPEAVDLGRAAALMAGMQQHPSVRDPALAWAVLPAHGLSGDAVAARRTASGRLVALLADATGHGLAAAGSLLPALQVFYAMAEADLRAGEVAREINRRLGAAGRTGRFIAAVVIELDPDGRRVAVWNGGMPSGLWLREQREVPTDALGSRHLPLGILADVEFDSTCSILETDALGQLVFCSDGLIEASDPAGEAFGMLRLRQRVLTGTPAEVVRGVLAAVRLHLGDNDARDDISLLMIAFS